jgi:hypothetical protein
MSTLTKELQSSLEAWSLSMQNNKHKNKTRNMKKKETFEEKYNIQIKCRLKQ